MKEKFEALLKKARENKDKLILVGGAVAGAVVGAAVVAVAAHLRAQAEESKLIGWEEDDFEDEEGED